MNPDAADVLARVERDGIETIRLSFPDPHGVLRGKTMDAGALARAFRDGVATVTTLLSKDTSGRTVFPTFSPGGGVGVAEMAGAGDMLMIPDPSTFRVLDWAGRTGWMLCDLVFTSGAPVPFCSRTALRRAVAAAATRGFDVLTGLEVEFHVFRLADPGHIVPGQPTTRPRFFRSPAATSCCPRKPATGGSPCSPCSAATWPLWGSPFVVQRWSSGRASWR